MKETLNNVQYIWVTLIWVNNNYFAWEVKKQNNFQINKYSRWNFE